MDDEQILEYRQILAPFRRAVDVNGRNDPGIQIWPVGLVQLAHRKARAHTVWFIGIAGSHGAAVGIADAGAKAHGRT